MKAVVISSIVWIPLALLVVGFALFVIGQVALVWKQIAGLGILAFLVWRGMQGLKHREESKNGN